MKTARAFALDCHDREAIGWAAATAGISGEMIRDMMVRCVERRFGAIRLPRPVQWLSDNGSIFAAHKTIEIALALNLAPCFTPIESPEITGMAEAFVKTFKRDYVRVSAIPDALAALALVDRWMEDYNTAHPHSPLGLPITPRIHPVPTRPVSGSTGSTPGEQNQDCQRIGDSQSKGGSKVADQALRVGLLGDLVLRLGKQGGAAGIEQINAAGRA
jgi:putative transposase